MGSSNTSIRRIGLGTVQFGMNYGVSNANGQTSPEEVRCILEEAALSGIEVIDTAAAYGESERVLGRLLPKAHDFRIVTKTIRLNSEIVGVAECERLITSFENSLRHLKVECVYGLLIHDATDLKADGGERLFECLVNLKSQGKAQYIGASVYNGIQIDFLLDRFPIDIVQLPINILDQRLVRSGHLMKLKNKNVEIHARSIFLQGLLLMSPATLPLQFDSVRNHLQALYFEEERCGLTPLKASLDFVHGLSEIDCAVLGVCSLDQLRGICDCLDTVAEKNIEYAKWNWDDEEILNPVNWKDDEYETEVS